ncbi:vegetative incompatibility protein HET-E-1 [Thozetella sp. PMI_491]|nr:vegetative incompatibility protein HET-E-1 [Thozetella sp. PMI_491]
MRLLQRDNTGAISLTEDLLRDIPPYAILSHTWGSEEVSFQDLKANAGQKKLGYEKIQFCGEQACRDGLSYFWVDTCCIDKSNNAELSEALNSMFRWYRNASRCYVYLADISTLAGRPSWGSFRSSRWFTRGWTLQELLAPAWVEFFSKEGERLGDKSALEQHIHDATRIPIGALRGNSLLDFRVAERLSWMEHRETTREEDKAYALLGLMNVFIPPIYGEGGENAHKRLLKEINQVSEPLAIPIAHAAFNSRAEEHSPRCHPHTRIDLLRDIEDWAGQPNSKGIYWLNGMAGTGKSTVSRTLAQRFHDRGVLGASFFFKRGEADRGDANKFFTTLAFQLAAKLPRIARDIRYSIEADPSLTKKSLGEQFRELILYPLASIRDPQTLLIVVDALDECDRDEDIKAIISLFSQTKSLHSVRLKVFLTSRPELPIRLGFNKIHGHYQDLGLHKIAQPTIEHDLRIFLLEELARICKEHNEEAFDDILLPSDWPDQHIDALVRLAIPLFIYAATICRFLEDRSLCDPAGQLEKLLDSQKKAHHSEEVDLDRVYLPILNHLLVGKTGQARERLVEGFRTVIGAIILLAEPLSASSLSRLLRIPLPGIHGQLKTLHSVLVVPSEANVPIRTFHLSFHDFLIDPSRATEFWVDEQATHERLATRCIQLLSTTLKRDICGLVWPGASLSQLDQQTIDASLPPEIRYACLHWVEHLVLSKTHINNEDLVHVFLKTCLLYWLEALCLIGEVNKSFSMLKSLQGLVKTATSIGAFLRDADRFIRNCVSIVTTRPLQLYSSAIVFSPENSVIRKRFFDEVTTCILQPPKVDLEWNACIQTLEGHTSPVGAVAFSPDGRSLTSASGNMIKLWDITTGSCTQTLIADKIDGITSLIFSRDSRSLVSGSPSTIRLWDLTTGTCTHTFEGNRFRSVALSADSQSLASGSDRGTINLWDLPTATCRQTFNGHTMPIYLVAFAPDNPWLASFHVDGAVHIWELTTGICTHISTLPVFAIDSAQFSPHVQFLAIGSGSEIRIWDITTGALVQRLNGHDRIVDSVAFSPDSRWLASSSLDQTIKLWDLVPGTCTQTFHNRDNERVRPIAFSPDGQLLASTSVNETIKLWDLSPRINVQPLEDNVQLGVTLLEFSPDGQWLASVSWNRTLMLWDLPTGTCAQILYGHSGSIGSLAFSPDSQWLASSSSDHTIKVWSVTTGALVQTIETGRMVLNLHFDETGSHLYTEEPSRFSTRSLDSSLTSIPTLTAASRKQDHQKEFSLKSDKAWIMWDNKEFLWLPPGYRPVCSAIQGSNIVIGCNTGRVLILELSQKELSNMLLKNI